MNRFFEENISWDKLAPHGRSEFVFGLESASLLQESMELVIKTVLNFVVPYGDLKTMREKLFNKVEGLKKVDFIFRYDDMVMKESEILKLYMPYLMNEVPELVSIAKTIDDSCIKKEDGCIAIYLLGEESAKRFNDSAAVSMHRIFYDKFGIPVRFIFKNRYEDYDRKLRQQRAQESEELSRIIRESEEKAEIARQATEPGKAAGENARNAAYNRNGRAVRNAVASQGQGGAKRRNNRYEGPVEGNRILGKPIDGNITDIKNLRDGSSNIAVKGEVFKTDSKTMKNGKVLVMLYLTDKTDSICAKMFVSEKKADDIADNIKKGSYVKIKGSCENDSFEKMTVLMAESIELADKPKREDTCERKRVELHAHTKMSRFDGLSEVRDLVNTAKAWGHPAVAVTDHGVVQSFPDAAKAAGGDIKIIYGVEGYLVNDTIDAQGNLDYKSNPSYHIILIAKNQTGLKNLYKLVSLSYLYYYYKKPRIPRSELIKHREGIIIGSACEAGEVFRTMTAGGSDEDIMRTAEFYDYLEIQPRSNNMFMLEKGTVGSEEELLEYNRRILSVGQKMNKLVVATCDTHYIEPEDYIYRNIIQAAHGYKDFSDRPSLYMRTTDEMLEEFSYLGAETAEKVVIDNTNAIADMVEVLQPVPKDPFPPKIEGSEERLRSRCYEKAHSIYGDPLPDLVKRRLDRELDSIIGNNYSVMYVAAEMLVQKSMDDGYLVGSRGSVGSSFAATMDGITEVNPLPPHYVCPNCKNSEFMENRGYDCGVDMPDKLCPVCGTRYKKDGFNIPFETFLGFEGDKEPDIDLNFAGEYQATAHKYVEEIFGAENVFKAGTISTVKDKTALGYVRKYFEERHAYVNKCEMERLALGCTGVRSTTGQHPGGIVIVPEGHEIYEFCPVMHPSEGKVKDIITTHFDYHKIDKNLLKLDILGHDVPSMIRMLQDMTGIAPDDVPLSDEKVNKIFLGCETLDIKAEDYRQKHGTFGIPEFGTSFTRQMLDDTKPEKFSALVRIAGFSHGTDVWINNAHDFILNGEATMDDAIATRDDIMNYLIEKGLPKQDAFSIMEHVRKGKGLKEEEVSLMQKYSVPEWYIESCRRIKYMFPKAHAVAYVMMSYRIAYFKVYYPQEFYATYFTMKVDFFNSAVIMKGMDAVTARMDAIKLAGDEASNKEKDEYIIYEVAYEMYARGYEFLPARLGHSKALKFFVEDGKVRLPFRALEGMGETAAGSLVEEYEKQYFSSIEDMMSRTSVNSSNLDILRQHGVLEGIPDSDQMNLFSMLG